MLKQGCFILLLTALLLCLSGCISGVWTGANLIYDRHGVYKKWDNYHLFLKVNNALTIDKLFKCSNCVTDIAVFNGDVLLTGHLPNDELLNELAQRLNKVQGYRRLFNEVKLSNGSSNTLQDSWITTKIRSQIFADDSIDPKAFKVITSDGVVYLMGDVHPRQAQTVVTIARQTAGVVKVVKILQYYTYIK